MALWNQLGVERGITCLIGGGGKTTLAHRLAAELPGTVIFCTTTKIFPSASMPVLCEVEADRLSAALERHRAVCIGRPTEEGKLAAPLLPFDRLRQLADYVIIEADGSKGLPCKAHRDYEPVLPEEADRVICLVGASGFGVPIFEGAHRPDLFARRCCSALSDPITPERLAAVLRSEGGFDTLIVNQAETAERLAAAGTLAKLMDRPVWAGSVREGSLRRIP